MTHMCPLAQAGGNEFGFLQSAAASKWCFVLQRFVFPVLSISCSIKSRLYPPLTLSSGKSPDLQSERAGAGGGQVWLSTTCEWSSQNQGQHKPRGPDFCHQFESVFLSVSIFSLQMEDCQQGGFGKHITGRLTRRECFLCVCACKTGRGEREDFPAWGRGRGWVAWWRGLKCPSYKPVTK